MWGDGWLSRGWWLSRRIVTKSGDGDGWLNR
jgi:hypothetical protein